MKQITTIIIGFFVFLATSSLLLAAQYKPGEVIVKFKGQSQSKGVLADVTDSRPELIAVDDTVQGLKILSQRDDVEYVEPNYVISVETVPNDWPYYESEWEDVAINQAWELIGQNGPGQEVIIAVIDSGVDLDHPELEDVLLGGYDFIHHDRSPEDDAGHGTKVCGIIGSLGDNNQGMAGVDWNIDVKIMPLKFMQLEGAETTGYISDAVDAVYYAVDHGVDIINASWGFDSFSYALEDAIEYARNNGVLFIASAGNSGIDNDYYAHYPSNYTLGNVIAVAAMTRYDSLASFSNYGYYSVDVAAPGVGLMTTTNDGGCTQWASGTSFAAPFVTSIAALVISQFPDLTYVEVKNRILKSTVMDEGYTEELLASGGCVNAYNALLGLELHEITSKDNWTPPSSQNIDGDEKASGDDSSGGGCFIESSKIQRNNLSVGLFMLLLTLFPILTFKYRE